MRAKLFLAGLVFATSCAVASAQQAQTVRLRGTIAKVDGSLMVLKTSAGEEAKLSLTPNAQVVAVVKASMADIKDNTFLGSAAMPQPDGSQKALEVHIFPESMRGTGEGHRPFTTPGSTMTNGAVNGATVTGVDGSTITVKYKEGEKKIVVPPNAPIVRYEIGSASDLKAGAAFTVTAATKKPDGSYEAARINVGRDGTVPQ
ncbi:hypothetical protein [Rhodoplanes sp. Z2-YC6860]|uniref:hypothetical protein n=1 Tax=Rhodoplanes sp. Z2-YC6860 TaxID=674703 RepID=UPI00078BF954|nr:hypothetical protein [Rhodoplanes sp. Z2-YC6860]AMN44421.1 hypothetical protein RHPLAN_60100 [Rhodoplanes sp. Z2-YC6860]